MLFLVRPCRLYLPSFIPVFLAVFLSRLGLAVLAWRLGLVLVVFARLPARVWLYLPATANALATMRWVVIPKVSRA